MLRKPVCILAKGLNRSSHHCVALNREAKLYIVWGLNELLCLVLALVLQMQPIFLIPVDLLLWRTHGIYWIAYHSRRGPTLCHCPGRHVYFPKGIVSANQRSLNKVLYHRPDPEFLSLFSGSCCIDFRDAALLLTSAVGSVSMGLNVSVLEFCLSVELCDRAVLWLCNSRGRSWVFSSRFQ